MCYSTCQLVNCNSRNASRIIRETCNCQSSCTVQASRALYGNPCSRFVEEAFIQYSCFPIISLGELVNHDHFLICYQQKIRSSRAENTSQQHITKNEKNFQKISRSCQKRTSVAMLLKITFFWNPALKNFSEIAKYVV